MHRRPDTGIQPEREPIARRSARASINAEVTLRRTGRVSFAVRLYDLSQGGCKLEFVERPHLHEAVWVKIEGLEALEAVVCWVKHPAVGLEFQKAIHPAVYKMLLSRLAGENGSDHGLPS